MAMPDDLTWVLKHLRARQGLYNLYRDYYRGYHRLAFTTEQWRSEFGLMVKGVADNHCPTVVDTLVDRLEIESFTGSQEQRAAEIWKDNRMDLRAGEVHKEAARAGDAFVLVWPDPLGDPTFYLNTADQLCCRYSYEIPGEIVYAGKVWIGEDDKAYATMYYRDRIEKYVTKARVSNGTLPQKGTKDLWEQRRVVVGQEAVPDSEEYTDVVEPWPLPNPFDRVPIFHFANDAAIGEYGKSELHDIVPLQDILNKDMSDRLITQEFHSFPQRWAVGLEPEYDSDGNAKSPDTGPNRIWFTPDKEGKFGQFDAANLEGFVKVADNDRSEIARVARIPQHQFWQTGTPPSGESLRTMEAPLMAKVKDRQDNWGATWEDLMEFAVALPSGNAEGIDLTTVWKDKTSISAKEKAEEMVLWQTLEVPIQMIWKRLGFTQDEIEEMLAMQEENLAARARATNSGINTGFESPTPTTSGNGTGNIEADVLINDVTGQ